MLAILITFMLSGALMQASNIEYLKSSENEIELGVKLELKDPIFKNSIIINLNNPNLKIKNYNIVNAENEKNNKQIKDSLKLDLYIAKTKEFSDDKFKIIINYQNAKNRQFIQSILPVEINKKYEAVAFDDSVTKNDPVVSKDINEPQSVPNNLSILDKINNYIESLVVKSGSIWIQLLAVLLLGLFMSLTPCIYPMIPITAGILQSYGSKSIASNIIASILYSLGIATTFSIFGLISASTGFLLGNVINNPIFVLVMVFILGYMALTMLDVINMYIPNFLQISVSSHKKWGIWSAYPFGILSGSVASPCLTPGLALLLTIVATLGNKFLGFILLFTAGIGLSLPMLIIGAFSSSIGALPKAGLWMNEVKKIFGFVMLGMCLFFLNKILPWNITLFLIAILCGIIGLYYFRSKTKKYYLRIGKIIISIIFFTLMFNFIFHAIQETMWPEKKVAIFDNWENNLETAIKYSKESNKKIFIDITGDFCSICKLIEKNIISDKKVSEYLEKTFINLKINSCVNKDDYETLRSKFQIMGVPTLLIIDSESNLIKKWGSEVYKLKPEEFLNILILLTN